jgi:hypothetical protein
VTVLGAVTDDGDSFYCWTEENLTRFHGFRLLEALKDKFGEELVVFLDRAGYFYARDLWEHVSGARETETVGDSSVSCVRGDDHRSVVLPVETSRIERCRRLLGPIARVVQVPPYARSLDAERLHSTRTERDHRTKHLAVSYW